MNWEGITMSYLRADSRQDKKASALWSAGLLTAMLLLFSSHGFVQAAGFAPPEECRNYTGDQHLDCLYSHIYQQETVSPGSDTHVGHDVPRPMATLQDQIDSGTPIADESATPPTQSMAAPQRPAEPVPTFRGPDECRAYTGTAHLNCLYAYIELQRSRNGRTDEDLRAQKQMLSQLNDQVNRQAAASHDLEQRLSERESSVALAPPVYAPPPVYPSYGYPGYGYPGYYYPRYYYPTPGLSLYLGLPGFYYGRPFYGPRFFGHPGHHRR